MDGLPSVVVLCMSHGKDTENSISAATVVWTELILGKFLENVSGERLVWRKLIFQKLPGNASSGAGLSENS